MEFGGFLNSVYELWRFAWPSLVFVAVIGFCVSRWFPAQASQYTSFAKHCWSPKLGDNRLKAALRSAGAEKTYPVALAVLTVLAMYLLGEGINVFGGVTPVIRPAPHAIALSRFSQDDIGRLHALYPSEQTFRYAYYAAERDLFPNPLPPLDGIHLKVQTLAKAVAYVLLLLVIRGLWVEKGRIRSSLGGMGVIAVCLLLWAICIPAHLWAYEDLVDVRAPEMTRLLKKRATDFTELPLDADKALPVDFLKSEPLWTADVDFTSRIVWCWKTLLEKPEDTPTGGSQPE